MTYIQTCLHVRTYVWRGNVSVEQTLFPAGIELICGGGDVKQVTPFAPFALPSNQFSQFDFDFSKQLEINTGQLIFKSTSICHLHQGY